MQNGMHSRLDQYTLTVFQSSLVRAADIHLSFLVACDIRDLVKGGVQLFAEF